MCKIGAKRRRTKTEIQAEREEEALKQEAVEDKLANYDLMMQRIQQLESQVTNNDGAAQIMNGMIERGEVVQNMDG